MQWGNSSGWRLLAAVWLSLLPVVVAMAGEAGKRAVSDKATVLQYREFPHGRTPYLSRLLVTREYLRFDDGHAADDYLLYDRRNRTIYSVDHEDRTVLVIPPRPVTVKPPIPLKLGERQSPMDDAPDVGGHRAIHYTFYANGKRCGDVMAVPGLLSDVRKALIAYRRTLAGQQAADMDKTPLSMQTACSLADLIFAPTRMLDHGLPVIEWRPDGDRKELLDYRRHVSVPPTLFRLPPAYRYYAIGPDGMVPAHPPAP